MFDGHAMIGLRPCASMDAWVATVVPPRTDKENVASGGRPRAIGSEKTAWMGARSATSLAPGAGVSETVGGVRSTTTVTGADRMTLSERTISATMVYDDSGAAAVSQVYS